MILWMFPWFQQLKLNSFSGTVMLRWCLNLKKVFKNSKTDNKISYLKASIRRSTFWASPWTRMWAWNFLSASSSSMPEKSISSTTQLEGIERKGWGRSKRKKEQKNVFKQFIAKCKSTWSCVVTSLANWSSEYWRSNHTSWYFLTLIEFYWDCVDQSKCILISYLV